jgi:dienelactone hydrolase
MLSFILACVVFVTNSAAPSQPVDAEARQRAVVASLTAQDFATIEAQFTDAMKAALPAGRLGTSWTALLAQAGALKGCGADPRVRTIANTQMVITTCEFERVKVDVQVAFDAAGKISGMAMRPAAAPATPYTPPAYVNAAAFTEKDVTIGGPDWPLPATLSTPTGAGPFPIVILVHGSGPNDRDETIGPNKPFRDLAGGLASRGIAVLRYDKRTLVHGARAAALPAMTVKDEVVDDVGEAIKTARGQDRIDPRRVFVLGHSLGGMLIPRILAANPTVAGAIVMAGAARALEDAIVEQMRYIAMGDGVVSPAEQAQIDTAAKNAAAVKSATAADAAAGTKLMGVSASYWLDLRGYDPPAAAAPLKVRMLVIQGERDYQVTMAEFARWRSALGSRQDVTFKSYPALNHLFIAGTGKSLPPEYSIASHVSDEVVRDIACWVSGGGC